MKHFKRLLLLSIVVGSLVLLMGCRNKTFLVSFETGTDLVIEHKEVRKGDLVSIPEDEPDQEGYRFLYWELKGKEYDFNTPVKRSFTLVAKWKEIITYKVVFDTNGGSSVDSQEVEDGFKVIKPRDVQKEGYGLVEWQLDGNTYDFNTLVKGAITLKAVWKQLTAIEEDMYLAEKYLTWITNSVTFPKVGEAHGSTISWEYDTSLINSHGIILFPKQGEKAIETEVTGTFKLGTETKVLNIVLTIEPVERLYLENAKTYQFKNLTTEYDIAEGALDIIYENRGNVPYVKLVDFLELLDGFIDPNIDFTFKKKDNYLKISYDHYDEEEDKTYHLNCEIDVLKNTIKTNDPGFFWAYIFETETNYGRHIFYDYDNADASYEDGKAVVFELNKYGLYSGVYEEEVVLPFYLVNQLFAGSSYYNVYFNGDNLYGIYALPDEDSDEYQTMKKSSYNRKDLPVDLVGHNYHMLAFNLDYFYGLKDIMKVGSYYTILENYQEKLLSTSPRIFDNALSTLIIKDIDEPHTSFGYPSYFNDPKWLGPSLSNLNDYGTRFIKWYYDAYVYVDDAIEKKWGRSGITSSQWAASSKSRPDYWFINNEHAVLILDDFLTADIEETTVFEKEIINKILKLKDLKNDFLPPITNGSKYYYYQNSDVKNNTVEILVDGVNKNFLQTYTDLLISKGFEHILNSSTTEYKGNGYFKINVDNKQYFLLINYDEKYEVFYLGITDKDEPETYAHGWPIQGNIKDLIKADSAVYMENTLKVIFKEKPTTKNVTLDLTWNGGGNVGALYRVLGFITDKPFRVSSYDRGTGAGGSTYVYIDGVTSYAHLNWSLLVSAHTFSAANSMATIFKENNLGLIVGTQTGGGTSSITPILLPSGTAFIMSSNNLSALRKGTGTETDPYKYIDNEYGVKPDHEISITNLYNETVLQNIFKTK